MKSKKFRIAVLILALLLSSSIEMARSEGMWVGSQEMAYSGVLNIDLGIFYSENQTLYWSFISTSDNINISIYKFVNFLGGGGHITLLAHGVSSGEGNFIAETSLNYSIRFAHMDWDYKEKNTTVTAVITDTAPSSNSTVETNTANSSIIIIVSTIFITSFFKKRRI
ncbi:MAG: hypothetical protein ACTSPM_00105 [Candidatus Heimdallarchaeota archaeon]